MRILVFFDLPMDSDEDRREYRRFRKFLITSGFCMVQESVYSKIALNNTVCGAIQEKVKQNKTKQGLIQMLTVTERQFQKMELVSGEQNTTIINDDRKLIIL